ncbi:MAG: GNAT family N-acetyltransferase [Desulfobacterales bacterium]|nr:GNAT family N-acetyltransferase [Desulfobacterales bacterium]
MVASIIRSARASENKTLTELTFESKGFWNYPEKWFKIWNEELTITSDYIKKNIVYVAESDGALSGYFSVVKRTSDFKIEDVIVEKGYFLDHIFIKPSFIRKKIGTKLITHALKLCKKMGVEKLKVMADSNCRGFYEDTDAAYLGEIPSNIENRTVSLFEYIIEK